MGQFSKNDKFMERDTLSLSDELLRHCTSVIYKAARALESILLVESKQRRGHPWAPEPKTENEYFFPECAGPLLVDGDHLVSFTWSVNDSFRDQFKIDIAQPCSRGDAKN